MKKQWRNLVSGVLLVTLSALTIFTVSVVSQTRLSGSVKIDGSSSVYPLTEAVAEEFQKRYPGVKVTVGISGTGGGFKKFGRGETDISNASRPIRPIEDEECRKNGIAYIELPVAYDALAVVVHPTNKWCNYLTVEELKRIWEPEAQGKIVNWSQVRKGFPNRPLKLYGAGADSGTYDFFTAAIVGKEHSSRGDYTASEDDNVLVQGVASDPNALGFIPFAYVAENRDRLKTVAIQCECHNNGKPMQPSEKAVIEDRYHLARPLFIYVNRKSADRPEVRAFVEFYLQNAARLAREVRYVPLPKRAYELAMERFRKRTVGSMFGAKGSQVGLSIEKLLAAEEKKTK
ncbi:MAG: PstS family phosphate ABC transporter substrate-binding protein [Armatimonadota bacterium]